MKPNGVSFRLFLRAARRRLDLTQVELSQLAKPYHPITAGRISDLERGLRRPTREEVSALAEALEEEGKRRKAAN